MQSVKDRTVSLNQKLNKQTMNLMSNVILHILFTNVLSQKGLRKISYYDFWYI